MAPEYAMHGYLTDKADVYSFGIVILEIVSGNNNTVSHPQEECFSLLDWVTYVLMLSSIRANLVVLENIWHGCVHCLESGKYSKSFNYYIRIHEKISHSISLYSLNIVWHISLFFMIYFLI